MKPSPWLPLLAALGVLTNGGCLYRLLEPPAKPSAPIARAAWTHAMSAPVVVAPQPLSGGRVAVMDSKGVFRVLSMADGAVLAEERLPFEPLRAASAGCDVMIAGRGKMLLSRCAEGRHRGEETELEDGIPVPVFPMDAEGGSVWIVVSSSGVHRLDTETGERETLSLASLRAAHHRRLGVGHASDAPDRLTGAAWLNPARPDVLYAAAESGLYAIHLERRRILWHRRMAGAPLALATRGRKFLYVGGEDKQIRALRAGSGRATWRLQTGGKIAAPLVVSPGPQGGSLYAASYDLVLYALRAHGGHRRWNLDLPGRTDDLAWWPEARSLAVRPLFSPDILLFHPDGGSRHGVFSLSKANDKDGDYFTSPMAFSEGMVVAGTYRGLVYAIRVETMSAEPSPAP